jgi:hypothetical protein
MGTLMLIDCDIPEGCMVRKLEGVPGPATAGVPELLRAPFRDLIMKYPVAPADEAGYALATFSGVRCFYLGAPNDEALDGHRLSSHGLKPWAFQEVINSDWISELERRNRVHPSHGKALFEGLNHYIVTFQDETFECIATAVQVVRHDEERR